MTFRLRLPTLFDGLFAAAQIRHASYWGECAHCYRATPWHVGARHDEYCCTACGHSPLAD